MRKINIVYDGNDAILKIKDDSLVITLSDEMIKIPYSNVKDFYYKNEDEELTIVRHGGSKIIINVQKDVDLLNKLKIAKTKLIDNEDNNSDNIEKTNKKESIKTNVVKESKNNVESNTNDRDNNVADGSNTVGAIIGLIIVGISIYFGVKIIFPNNSNDNKINGCYYITEHIYSNSSYEPSLCFEGSTVTLKINKDKTEFDYKWYTDTLYIENNYGDTLFSCTLNKDDNKLLQCTSYNKAIGLGKHIWEKR